MGREGEEGACDINTGRVLRLREEEGRWGKGGLYRDREEGLEGEVGVRGCRRRMDEDGNENENASKKMH